jgi:hypothetical protein
MPHGPLIYGESVELDEMFSGFEKLYENYCFYEAEFYF